jgi:hypothetical protein
MVFNVISSRIKLIFLFFLRQNNPKQMKRLSVHFINNRKTVHFIYTTTKWSKTVARIKLPQEDYFKAKFVTAVPMRTRG